ncbi:hypothetical protein M0R45_024400 [Rubus argutus]|uniref:Exonuclease 1 n=1 Tax=Rubus argutus TaxID=59490 RepID=A0AAW1WQV9_RUBAR
MPNTNHQSPITRSTRHSSRPMRGTKVGVDATLWLSTVYNALGDHERQVEVFKVYCRERIEVLKRHGITDITMVFDGNATPIKTQIEIEKIKEMKGNKSKMKDKKNKMKKEMKDPESFNVKPVFKYIPNRDRLLEWLTSKDMKIKYIVAPYEADAQLTYLAVKGIIDAVITEDSDLIPFGCPNIIYRLNIKTEMYKYYSLSRLNELEDYKDFTDKKLLEMCIMTGCDYLPNMEN